MHQLFLFSLIIS